MNEEVIKYDDIYISRNGSSDTELLSHDIGF